MAPRARSTKRTTPRTTRIRRKPATGLHRYLYVEVRAWFRTEMTAFRDAATGASTVDVLNGPLSFDSIRVRAVSEAEAYNIGPALLQDEQTVNPAERCGHLTGQRLNDYVVRL